MTKIAKKLAILLVLITKALISFNQVKAVDLNLTENTSSSNSTLSSDDEDDEEEDEILNALDRYFEAPEPSDEEKKESDT